jgi:hypothetical protein
MISISGSKRVKPDYIIQILLSLVTAAQLTIFMLQMKSYKRKSSPPSFSSIRGNSLFLAGYIISYLIHNEKQSTLKSEKYYKRVHNFSYHITFRISCVSHAKFYKCIYISIALSYNNSHSILDVYEIVHLISKIILLIFIARGFNLLAKQCQVIRRKK